MTRKGQTAILIFCALSLGGILTLFSQADALRDQPARLRSMDVSSPEGSIFRSMVPTTMESGASLRASPDSSDTEDPERPKPPVRLRLR